MNILNVAYPFAPVSKHTCGGSEQILYQIDSALVHSGHESFVIGEKNSEVKGKLISNFNIKGEITDNYKNQIYENYRNLIDHVIQLHNIDLIHMHGIDFYQYLPGKHLPILITLHLPVDWYPADILNIKRENLFFNCVSKDQMESARDIPNLIGYIRNGININDFYISSVKKKYAIALGRICPEKGFHYAIQAAKKANIPLLIAGELFNYEYHQKYFEEKIKPELNENCIYLGTLNLKEKSLMLSLAKCLLITTEARETSSLVAMEALASGTPVVSFNRGAISEIVENEKTGFIVNSVEEMINAIKDVSIIDPLKCRSRIEKNYSSKKMTRGYFNLYLQIIKKFQGLKLYNSYGRTFQIPNHY